MKKKSKKDQYYKFHIIQIKMEEIVIIAIFLALCYKGVSIYYTFKRYDKDIWKNDKNIKFHKKMEKVLLDTCGSWISLAFQKVWLYLFYTSNYFGMMTYISFSIVGYLLAL